MYRDAEVPKPLSQDNKLIDFVGAVMSGVAISLFSIRYLNRQEEPWVVFSFLRPGMVNLTLLILLLIGAYALPAAVLFQWKARLRVKVGWLLIAVLGSILAASLIEFGPKATLDNIDRMPFPEEEILGVTVTSVIHIFVTVPIMAAVHYLGLALRRLSRAS